MDKIRLSSAGVTSKCTTAVTFSRLSAGVTSKLAQPGWTRSVVTLWLGGLGVAPRGG
eukprot:COSAG05_NODE_43_length_25931_cov_49.314636_12_plen_57_part_00